MHDQGYELLVRSHLNLPESRANSEHDLNVELNCSRRGWITRNLGHYSLMFVLRCPCQNLSKLKVVEVE